MIFYDETGFQTEFVSTRKPRWIGEPCAKDMPKMRVHIFVPTTAPQDTIDVILRAKTTEFIVRRGVFRLRHGQQVTTPAVEITIFDDGKDDFETRMKALAESLSPEALLQMQK